MKYMCRIQPRLFNFYVFIFVLVKVPSFNGNFTENKAEAVTKLIGLSPWPFLIYFFQGGGGMQPVKAFTLH